MNSLRFLLVHRNPEQSEAIEMRLARANHSLLKTSGFEEAADALTVERFDAILVGPDFLNSGLQEFSAQLRRMESQGSMNRVPVILLADVDSERLDSGLDAVIPEPIDPDALTAAVTNLARAVTRDSIGSRDGASSEGILDPDKFREQVGFDNELMLEIIELFLNERKRQEPEMREALMAGQFDLLSRLAHTMKGSLSSLHAMRARKHAQDLEYAAKHADEDSCWASLAALENDLIELEPELLALR